MLTDPAAAISPTGLAKPGHLQTIADPDYGTALTNPVGPSGAPIAGIGGTWGNDSRHGHSARQPWNDDGSLLLLEQRNPPSGSPSSILLDGRTFAPLAGNRGTSNNLEMLELSSEDRWMPGKPDELVSITKDRVIVRWNVRTGERIASLPIAIPADLPASQHGYVGWRGEASISADGRWTVVGTHREDGGPDHAAVVDLERWRIGPWQSLAIPNSFRPSSRSGQIGHGDVSVDGRVYWCKLAGSPEIGFVYDVDPDALTLSPRTLDTGRLVNAEAAGIPNAVIALSHASMGITPGGVPCLVGGVRTYSAGTSGPAFDKANGRVLAVMLDNGNAFSVSPGTVSGVKENSDEHTSARCYKRPGWALVTYARGTGAFAYELVFVKLDGSKEIERVGVTRTYEPAASYSYRAEAHGCPSPDGKRVIFATNWNAYANPLGDPDHAKAMIYTLDGTAPPDDDNDPPPPADDGAYVVRPLTVGYAIFRRAGGSLVHPEDCVKIMNAHEKEPQV